MGNGPVPIHTLAAGARARARCGPRACASIPGPMIMIPLPPRAESRMRLPPGMITSCVRTVAIISSIERGGGSGLVKYTGPSPRCTGRWGAGGRVSASPSFRPSRLFPPAWAAATGS